MHALFKIIQKNFKLLIRSKSSALIIILGPLLVIFLVGIAFDNVSKYSLNIGTYSGKYNDLTESFIKKMQEKEFKVQKFDSEESCVESIKYGKIHTCIVFPPNMQIESTKTNEITFHIDNSKINLVWMILDTLSSKLTERSSELSMDLTTNLLNKVELTRTELFTDRPIITNLQTENKEITSKINTLNQNTNSMSSLKQRTSTFKNFLTNKVNSIEENILSVEESIDSLDNFSDKNKVEDDIEDIKTTILGLKSQIENNEGDYAIITKTINEIESSLKSTVSLVKSKLSQSSSKITQIKSSLDKIYSALEEIKINNAATIVNPITTNIKPVISEKSYLGYMFPALIVLVVMFISILLSTTLVMMEKHSPAYFRNFITPTRNITFILGTYFTNILIVTVQLIIIIAISLIFFKSQILSTLPVAALLLLLTTSFFTFAGMLVGNIFTSEETATLASISLGSIFLFLSNVILPIESMPEYIRNIAKFNPFVIAENLLKKTILFQSKLSALANDIYLLLGYSAALFILVLLIQSFARKHLLFAMVKHKKKKTQKK
ncbi:ABC transporter permease [Candidatus Woesearchaeota archaeon]|nr:ABC transporter permease [Candidatus Woesearchaeota archaeon]